MGLALDPPAYGLLILSGGIIGLCFGLFGQAAGLAVAPALLLVLPYCGLPALAVPKLATATAIAILIPLSIAQAQGQVRWRAIDWDLVMLLAPSVAVGAVLITTFAGSLDERIALLLLLAATVFLALRHFWGVGHPGHAAAGDLPLIAMTLQTVASGALAALTGIGAGLFTAPALAKALVPERAAATASALTLPFALAASAGYLLSPAPPSCGPVCAGAIFLPALATSGMAAVLIAPLGLRLRPLLPLPAAGRLFALLAIAGACTAGFTLQTLRALVPEAREAALELILGPLCEADSAPAVPGFEGTSSQKVTGAQPGEER